MSNRFIDQHKSTVVLMIDLLERYGKTRNAEQLRCVYGHAFVTGVLSDQSFYEAVTRFALKCMRICVVKAQISLRKCDFAGVRDWIRKILLISQLLNA